MCSSQRVREFLLATEEDTREIGIRSRIVERRKDVFYTAHHGVTLANTVAIASGVKPIFRTNNKRESIWNLRITRKNDLPRFYLPRFSPSLFLSRSSLSSRAAFRMFGRALNWMPFKTWELFNAPPRYASTVCYLVSRAWLELRARAKKNVAPSTVRYDYL